MMLKKNDNAQAAPAPKFDAPKKQSKSSLGDMAVIGSAVLLVATLVFQLMSLKALFLF